MLDLDLILDHTDDVARWLATKGIHPAIVHSAREAVVHRRQLRAQLDEARAVMNRESKEMGRLAAAKDPSADARRAELGQLLAALLELRPEVCTGRGMCAGSAPSCASWACPPTSSS